jgi:hypothetical protein
MRNLSRGMVLEMSRDEELLLLSSNSKLIHHAYSRSYRHKRKPKSCQIPSEKYPQYILNNPVVPQIWALLFPASSAEDLPGLNSYI